MDGTKTGDNQGAAAADFEHDQAFAAEERLGTRPLGVDLDTRGRSQIRARLHQQRIIVHLDHGDIPRQGGCQENAFTTGLGGVSVEEKALASEHGTRDGLQETTTGLGFQLHIGRHGHHRPTFCLNTFFCSQDDSGDRIRGPV